MRIHWYPGHMAKTRRLLIESLKLVDVVVELLDARAPRATANPDLNALLKDKTRIIVLNKCDLADLEATKRWVLWYEAKGLLVLPFNSAAGNKKAAAAVIEKATAPLVAKMKEKGVNKTVRAQVVGIPNVGKSTFINCIAGAARTKVGNKPGVTRGKQWVKITPYFELLDTPGLLWPKLENEAHALSLAFIGAIKDEILDVEELAAQLLIKLQKICPKAIGARFEKIQSETRDEDLLLAVCASRGFLLHGGMPDYARGARIVLDEFRAGKIACVTLDEPNEADD